MKRKTNQVMLAVVAAYSLFAANDALAEISTRDRCQQALKMMGVTADRADRGWASLCEGVIKNEPIARYGKWYGPGYWGGGTDANKAGLEAPMDSLDEVAQRHDFGYVIAEKYGKIYGKQYEFKLKAMADRVAVQDSMKLPEDPTKWDRVPADPEAAVRYHDRIITGFILESDLYKNLADATKVGDVITSPFITLFDETDYSHIPDLDKFQREVSSHINGWKKEVAAKAEEDKKAQEAAEKAKADQAKQAEEAAAKEKAEKEGAARKEKEAQEAKEARKRLEDKIKETKEAEEEESAPKPPAKKSYADMTPEERHEALKNNDAEAWEAVRKGLTGEEDNKGEKAPLDTQDAEEAKPDETPAPSAADSEITPVKVTASGSFDGDYSYGGFKNIVTTTISVSFWNVGSQVPGYGEASMKSKSVASLNGVSEEKSCGGTFSGGPNGTLSFQGECGGTTLNLKGGSSISADGAVLTVSNPEAFSAWEK